MTLGEALHEPVFIVGQARAGSSILYRLIQEHPRFLPAAGLNLSESHFLDVISGNPDLGVLSMRAFAEIDDDAWARFEASVAALERRRQLALKVPRRVLLKSVQLWSALGCAAMARAYLETAAQGRGAQRMVEKTPNNLPWVRHLLHVVPDARLVVIARHPLATYASFRRRAAEDVEAPWAELTPDAFATRWQYEVRVLGELATGSGNRLRVERYEHLVADPEAFQRRLFAWLGEEPRAELPVEVEINPNSPAADSRQLFGAIGATGHEWQDYVPEAEAAAVEKALATPMALLGYVPALS